VKKKRKLKRELETLNAVAEAEIFKAVAQGDNEGANRWRRAELFVSSIVSELVMWINIAKGRGSEAWNNFCDAERLALYFYNWRPLDRLAKDRVQHLGRVERITFPYQAYFLSASFIAGSQICTICWAEYGSCALQDVGTWVTDLTLIDDGLTKAEAFAVPGNPANQQQVAVCVAQIDLLANTVIAPNPQELGPKINTLLTGLQQQLAGAQAAPQALGAQVSLPTPAQLEVSIDRFSLLAWAWILVVTIAANAYNLIFPTKGLGFGTPEDYLLCFFRVWGYHLERHC
jgi:hypothetical protein